MTTAIILAAGKSTRMGAAVDKAFLSLIDKPVLAWSLLAFERTKSIDRIILVVRKDKLLGSKEVARRYGISKLRAIVAGGSKRQESVQAGLEALDLDTREVLIHDAARPCITPAVIDEVVCAVKAGQCVTVGRAVTDTLKRCAKGTLVTETVPRDRLWQVQTPQAFPVKIIRDAYKALPPKTEVTDDCQAVELSGVQVKVIESDLPNIKITTAGDLQIVSKLLK